MPKHYSADTFHLQDSIGYLVKHTQRAMFERVEGLFAAHGFTFQQWVVLMHLRDGLALTVADLSRELQHDSGAMTRLIDQLEERGLLERRRNVDDRRVIELSLTAKGRKTVASLIPIVVNALNMLLDGFSREEVRLLKSFLRRIMARIRELDPVASAEE